MPANWSRAEVEVLVTDYLDMLEAEQRRRPYSKAEHRRRLEPVLEGRTKSSVEMKRQNVSAVLVELGVPPLRGYVPLFNYQALVRSVVVDAVRGAERLLGTIAAEVMRAAKAPEVSDIMASEVPVPSVRGTIKAYPRVARERERAARLNVDYLAIEAANRSLGAAGEEFVVRYEQARLRALHEPRLAKRVEHVATTRGDGLGYDVLSFERDETERLIEVKTTASRPEIPFYVTRNEVAVSRECANRFHLYRLFDFRDRPRFFRKSGALDQAFALDPTQFEARIA